MDTYSSEHLREALNDRGLVALPCPSVGCMTLVNAGGSRFAPCASDLAAAGFSTGASCIITGALPRADLWSAVSWGGRSEALVVGVRAAIHVARYCNVSPLHLHHHLTSPRQLVGLPEAL